MAVDRGQASAYFSGSGLCPVSYTHLDVYKRQVLEGVEETENALNALDAERRRAEWLATGATAARRAAANADLLYRQGLASLTDVLDATVALRQAELNSADVREREALALVALYLSLIHI